MTHLLDIKDLQVTFPNRHGDLRVLDGVSLHVGRGEILGIIGESGAGKSMTGNAVMGLLEPPGKITKGDILFDGVSIIGKAEGLRGKHISMIFQDPLTSLNPLKRVGDMLTETMRTHLPIGKSEAEERARASFEEVGLDPSRLDAYPHEFSGGMRQRVVIALALAGEPELLIADEPTTALDVSVQAQILELIRNLCEKRGLGVMLITHDIGVIANSCDRVAVFYAGRPVEIAGVSELLAHPKHPYSKGLIASMPRIDADSRHEMLRQIEGSMPALNKLPKGCAFAPRCHKVMDKCLEQQPIMQSGRAACWLGEA
ncbi:MAG TPA: dipeptide/oligopeptide/nickel ABC transporter ATP-binding protein [Alphaproteobacteria bacterium]|nr:dipeptide/oligopeptide/nickel ABC transporter ATP-binding protein [Alphaproteobacteria bacterium]